MGVLNITEMVAAGLDDATNEWADKNGITNLETTITKPRIIMLQGTSIDVGFNQSYPSGNSNSYQNNPARKMRNALIGAGYYAQDEYWQGTMGYTSAAGFSSADSRVVIGSGWDYQTIAGANWSIIRNNSTTNPITYNPDTQCDTVFVVARSSGAANMSVAFGGQTKTLTVNATAGYYTTTISPTDGVVLGNNNVVITRGGGTCEIVSVWAYNSKLAGYQILNCSASGARLQHVTGDADAGRPLFYPELILKTGDEIWMDMGPNDWRDNQNGSGTLEANIVTYKANLTKWIDRRQANNIKCRIVIPPRTSISAASIVNQNAYNAAIREVALAKNVEVFDFKDRWGEHAEALAKGLMVSDPDYFHPTWYGSQDMGLVYSLLAQQN